MMVSPRSRASGTTSASIPRSIRLYSFWITVGACRPSRSATSSQAAIRSTLKFDTPTSSISPSSHSRENERAIFSIGRSSSSKCA